MNIIKKISIKGTDLELQYSNAGLNYPKFFKMDKLCKLGYLACAKLLDNIKVEDDEVAMIMFCKSSSLDTDIEFEQTIFYKEKFFPSPSIFVYTLPNIVLGEIAIAFNIKGENCCYIVDNIEEADFEIKIRHLFNHTSTQKVICAWIEYSASEQYAEMTLIEKKI
ncbi:MAG: hypothetical protein ACRCZB_08875 [Bacteroidales bacterium]